MKPSVFALGVAAIWGSGSAGAVDSFGPTLGYYKFDVPSGNSMWVCGLVKAKDHQGAMDNSSFTVADGKTTIEETDRDLSTLTLDKHYVEILEPGMWEGLVLDIDPGSVTPNSLKVEADLTQFTGLPVDAAFAIREHNTLGTMFPGGEGLTPFSDSITLYGLNDEGSPSSETYLLFDFGVGPFWADSDTASADNVVVRPGQGFMIFSSAPTTLLFGKAGVCHVKDTPTLVEAYGGAVNLMGLLNPLVGPDPDNAAETSSEPLGAMGFVESFGLFSDSVAVYSRDGNLSEEGSFLSFDFGTGAFLTTDGATDEGSTEVPVGAAVNVSVNSGAGLFVKIPVLHPVN